MSEISHILKNVRTLSFRQVDQAIAQATLPKYGISDPAVLAYLILAGRVGGSEVRTYSLTIRLQAF